MNNGYSLEWLPSLWGQGAWNTMPKVEQIARIVCSAHAPPGLRNETKEYVDRNFGAYLDFADMILRITHPQVNVHKRVGDFQASLDHLPGIWACGRTRNEALGNLLQSGQDMLGLTIVERSQ